MACFALPAAPPIDGVLVVLRSNDRSAFAQKISHFLPLWLKFDFLPNFLFLSWRFGGFPNAPFLHFQMNAASVLFP